MREWGVPQPPELIVARTHRGDFHGGLRARRQIDDAEFAAGRAYAQLHERARRGLRAASLDGKVDYATFDAAAGIDRVSGAVRKLQKIEGAIAVSFGVDSVAFLRAVLIDGIGICRFARERGVWWLKNAATAATCRLAAGAARPSG